MACFAMRTWISRPRDSTARRRSAARRTWSGTSGPAGALLSGASSGGDAMLTSER
jgi:hypothetical protein